MKLISSEEDTQISTVSSKTQIPAVHLHFFQPDFTFGISSESDVVDREEDDSSSSGRRALQYDPRHHILYACIPDEERVTGYSSFSSIVEFASNGLSQLVEKERFKLSQVE